MSKPMKKMLMIVGIVFGLIFAWYGIKKIFFIYYMSHYQPPPVTVSASTVTTQNWQSYLTSVGTVTAINGVEVSSETSGIVKELHFESGQSVKQGDVLVVLNTDIEQAQLKDAQSKLKLAQINYDRNKTLAIKNAVSAATLDTITAQLQQAQADLEQVQAKIKQKTVTAPFAGKIGIREINLGEYVPAGTAMASLQSLDPLYVRFNLPEQYVPELYLQQPVEVSFNLSGGKSFKGFITGINSKVDQATRNILVQATIPNKEFQLYPGMFSMVKIYLRERKNVLTLPQTTISYSLHGDSVFLIKSEGKDKDDKPILKAYREYVKTGERRGSEIAIMEGIKTGDKVVTSGQLKLQNGTRVVIDNKVEL